MDLLTRELKRAEVLEFYEGGQQAWDAIHSPRTNAARAKARRERQARILNRIDSAGAPLCVAEYTFRCQVLWDLSEDCTLSEAKRQQYAAEYRDTLRAGIAALQAWKASIVPHERALMIVGGQHE